MGYLRHFPFTLPPLRCLLVFVLLRSPGSEPAADAAAGRIGLGARSSIGDVTTTGAPSILKIYPSRIVMSAGVERLGEICTLDLKLDHEM